MVILDTNVVSELMRLKPNPTVFDWLRRIPRDEFWSCSVVMAEVVAGIELLPAGKRRDTLKDALEAVLTHEVQGQIAAFDLAAAQRYGALRARRQQIGRPIHELDAQIAAIAAVHNATLATRNTGNFEHCGIKLVNPWESA